MVRNAWPQWFGMLLGGVLLAVLAGSGCSSGDNPAATVEPAAEATSSATPTGTEMVATAAATSEATPIATAEAGPQVEGVEIEQGWFELPVNVAIVIAAENRLVRRHRTIEGTIEERVLLDPEDHGPSTLVTYWNIHHVGPTLRHGQLAVAVCTSGECGEHGGGSEDARASILQSRDGGVTWQVSELDDLYLIASATEHDRLLISRLIREGRSNPEHFEWWPSGEEVERPWETKGDFGAHVLRDGTLTWWTRDGRLIDSAGRELLALGGGAQGTAVLPEPNGDRLAVTWQQSGEWRWSIAESSGEGYTLARTFAAPVSMLPTAWLGESRLLVNGDFTEEQLGTRPAARLAAVLDFGGATATLLPFGEDLGFGWAVAAQVGPFAEVNAGEGDCLNIRSGPSLNDEVLECVADGVLLEQLAPPGRRWSEVRAPSATVGWASNEFLAQPSDGIVEAIDYLLQTMHYWLRISQGWTPECGPGDGCMYAFDFPENVAGAVGRCGKTDVASFRTVRQYREELHEELIAYGEVPCAVLLDAQERLGPPADTPEWRAVVAEVAEYLEPRYGLEAGMTPPSE